MQYYSLRLNNSLRGDEREGIERQGLFVSVCGVFWQEGRQKSSLRPANRQTGPRLRVPPRHDLIVAPNCDPRARPRRMGCVSARPETGDNVRDIHETQTTESGKPKKFRRSVTKADFTWLQDHFLGNLCPHRKQSDFHAQWLCESVAVSRAVDRCVFNAW